MPENKPTGCTGDCSTCGSKCSEEKQDMRIPCGEFSEIKHVIGVVSGKGGVGKSLVTSLLASETRARGFKTAVLDADITGPSIPRSFGINTRAKADARGLLPEVTQTGIEIMSINLLMEKEDQPVVWRGPVISGVIQQFWQEVAWGEVDYMFVDMPPGTGDVPLTVFQSLPVDGIVIVTTPQDLVNMIVRKAYNMAKLMDIPVIGIIENMSYIECPDCGKKISVFGESSINDVANQLGVPVLAALPIKSSTAAMVDHGDVESIVLDGIKQAADVILG
ncbi:MAG: Mrp/NBP35 family ATP-binding protein [Clostridiales bacterium]|nr:Mrp/NBP35 family ATP-binding protein [Clostridiales bacterium]